MISGVVLEEQVEDIARQPKPRVIINSFNHSKAEKYHGCSCSHSRDKKREGSTQSVEQKSLKWVIVKGADCIRNNQPMVLRVDMTIQEFVLMHISVHKVLPCIHDKHRDDNLQNLHRNRCLGCDAGCVCLRGQLLKQLQDRLVTTCWKKYL